MADISRNESITVGASNTEIAPARKRKVIYIRNTHATNTLTVVFGSQSATAGAGIVLKPNEYLYDSNNAGYECWQGTILGIADAANTTVAVFER